ncbi:pyruvate kinase [Lutibacter sp. A64]|uniref:pyruvate kinase n=1 Tax=Lutibacter sp. A64 TaxID=2918526 RepID=UPI001F059531|nr:pyruvate kinase [Lutibacter sp. A64]UMB53515.1 pyruvate kinase [Lutibacter sp. A64]
MLFETEKLEEIRIQIDLILEKILEYENRYKNQILGVHPNYTESAKNLIHYLALRSFDNAVFQDKLSKIGLPNTSSSESSVLHNLLVYKTIINHLLNNHKVEKTSGFLTKSESKKLIKKHVNALFGKIDRNRNTRILVTQPTIASEDKDFAKNLTALGMDAARINCAHDSEPVWSKIIANTKQANPNCKIFMDLGGPKLRTGKMKPGYKVIHIKPKRNTLGQVIVPAKVWLAPFGMLPPENAEVDAIIPVNKKWLQKTRKGSYVTFLDSRGKKCKITIESKEGYGRWASCSDSAFVTTGTQLTVFLEKKSTSEIHTVHEILPLEEIIFLFEGDTLKLNKAPILGEPTKYDEAGNLIEYPHISCTLPQLFSEVKKGELIYFDDGKIEGIIKEVASDFLLIKITNAKKNGSKLKADKGINLPNSDLGINGLTEKDKEDLKFVAKNADAVNFSFVNSKNDVEDLLNEFKKLNADLSIVLKIETKKAFRNLPSILLKAMENYPIGVMIARGDLAIETGWKNFAVIQEEIIHICEAAHIPDIWATQVLENLAKKGIPTRAEITDAAMSQRVSCAMLNKGIYIEKAVKMLDKILCKMQSIQNKKIAILPKLEFSKEL